MQYRNIEGGASGLLDHLGMDEGDILVRGATGWEVLAPGTSTDVLTSNGTGAVPSWEAASTGGVTSVNGESGAITLESTDSSVAISEPDGTHIDLSAALDGLSDVSFSGVADKNVIYYDNGSSKWKNSTLSTLLDTIGSTRGSILYRGSSGWSFLTPGTSGYVLTSNGSGADPTWSPASGGGGSGTDLWDWSAGFPALGGWTQFGISGGTSVTSNGTKSITVVDTGSSSADLRGMYIAVPVSTPYRVAICMMTTGMEANWASSFVGFTDGTKFDIFRLQDTGLQKETWSNRTTRNTFGTVLSASLNFLPAIWYGVRDDGTNVYLEYSIDGANWRIHYSSSKSGGYLGSSGYTNICWGLIPDSFTYPFAVSLRCYDTNGLSRVVG